MTPHEFKAKWSQSAGSERQTYQEHFRDLCDLLGQPRPSAADRADLDYTFEKPVTKAGGGQGFADVWRRGCFGWEYKAREADLAGAYVQLLGYMNDLENPPLLVVSTTRLIRVYPTFQNQRTVPVDVPIDAIDDPKNLDLLRRVFADPSSFRTNTVSTAVTEAAAERFGRIAAALQGRGEDPQRVAHFLVQLLFCLFAEDTAILPKGLFGRLLAFGARTPAQFAASIGELLRAMTTGGWFWGEEIPHVNGGLFREVDVVALAQAELAVLAEAATLDWSRIEPAVFGTLFERSLDPKARAQLGAHYTGRSDIERVVEPVVMVPLRRRWEEVKQEADVLLATWKAAPLGRRADTARDAFARRLNTFRAELRAVRILDPACGSGNFLYVALDKLLELENEVIWHGVQGGLPGQFPEVGTDQLLGLEVNAYARELAQVVVWIGYLQWRYAHGFGHPVPVLAPLETIALRDALLDRTDPEQPKEAAWPTADFIVGNPPFIGDKKLRGELGGAYTDALWRVFAERVPPGADLVTYFFEKARGQIAAGKSKRAGLLTTNSIRGGANRVVLDRIKATGDIFMAWNDEPWVLNGADVRISIVGFDDGSEVERLLDDAQVDVINADLTSSLDVTKASRLAENRAIAFLGVQKGGPFDVSGDVARTWLSLPVNPNGRSNADVVKPRLNGYDIVRRNQDNWIVDFGPTMPEHEAAFYEAPFEHVRTNVKPLRDVNPRKTYREKWWIHTEPRQGLRAKLASLRRYICTPTVAKHRIFVWADQRVVPDHQLVVFARDDDYFLGVLQTRAHEVWSLRMGTSLEDRPRYTPTTCFETFPLPWPPGREPAVGEDGRVAAIAETARALDELRTRWLNPEGATAADLKTRTLTNLYNARPTWLANAHGALDRAVWAAYEWDGEPGETTDEDILTRLLALNGAEVRSR